jgi:hypothetical protein
MIVHFGVRTTEPIRVAYKVLEPDEDVSKAVSELLSRMTEMYYQHHSTYDHSMIVYYDPPGTPGGRREVMVPLPWEIEGVESKTFPSIRAAFLVYEGAGTPVEVYHKRLEELIDHDGLVRDEEIHSVEIMYVPEDLDYTDYTIEIMFPVKR